MHSISYKSEKLDFTVGEAIISSGSSESINIKYLNPFNFWSWENIGSTTITTKITYEIIGMI